MGNELARALQAGDEAAFTAVFDLPDKLRAVFIICRLSF